MRAISAAASTGRFSPSNATVCAHSKRATTWRARYAVRGAVQRSSSVMNCSRRAHECCGQKRARRVFGEIGLGQPKKFPVAEQRTHAGIVVIDAVDQPEPVHPVVQLQALEQSWKAGPLGLMNSAATVAIRRPSIQFCCIPSVAVRGRTSTGVIIRWRTRRSAVDCCRTGGAASADEASTRGAKLGHHARRSAAVFFRPRLFRAAFASVDELAVRLQGFVMHLVERGMRSVHSSSVAVTPESRMACA